MSGSAAFPSELFGSWGEPLQRDSSLIGISSSSIPPHTIAAKRPFESGIPSQYLDAGLRYHQLMSGHRESFFSADARIGAMLTNAPSCAADKRKSRRFIR